MPKKLAQLDRGRLNALKQLLAQHRQLSDELGRVAANRTQLATRRDQLQETVNGLVAQHDAAEEEVERLQSKYNEHDGAASQLQARIASQEHRIRSQGPRVQIFSGKVAALQGQVAELEDQIAKQRRQLQKLAAQAGLITENKLELVRQRTGAETEAEKARRVVAAYERALAGIDQPLAELRKRLLRLGDSQDPDVAKQCAVLQRSVADLESQRETIVLRGRGRYLHARRAIQDATTRVSDIDSEIQRLDAERARPARQYRTIERQINDKLDQLAGLRSQRDRAAAPLASHQTVLADATRQHDALRNDHRQKTSDRDAVGQARDIKKADRGKLRGSLKLAREALIAAVAEHGSADASHATVSADVNRVAGEAVTALTDAVGIATAGLAAIQNGIATFGSGLPKIPTVVQTVLTQLGTQRVLLEGEPANITPLDIANAPGHVQRLERLFGEIDNVVTRFNTEVDRTPRELDNEFAATSEAITRAAKAHCNNSDAEYNNAVFVDNQLAQGTPLRNIVFDRINANKNACLQNHAPVQAALLTDVDELLRRYRIFLLRAKYNQVCFSTQVPGVLRGCLAAAGTTPAAAENQVRDLRLNPTIGDLRIALGVPAGRGWTMWGTTSAYDGVEIHVTISADSIKLQGAAINTFHNGAALFNAVFILPPQDDWKEVHATLNVAVWGNQHPAVFVGGQAKLWYEYQQLRQNRGESAAVAQQHMVAAQGAVQMLLNQWIASMQAQCQFLINRVNQLQPQDIRGQALPQ
jgi:predicted  nucleic acid-binding Zn-ribbon protein